MQEAHLQSHSRVCRQRFQCLDVTLAQANAAVSIGKISFTAVGGPPGENSLLLQLVILLPQLMAVCINLKLLVGHSPVHLLQELKV